jgi:hypothetical protein
MRVKINGGEFVPDISQLALHRGSFNLDLGHPRLDLTLRNLQVNGEWIEGDVEIKAEVFGKKLDKTEHFKTLNHADTDIEIGAGASLKLNVVLENPKRACATATLHWGPVTVSVPQQCVDF